MTKAGVVLGLITTSWLLLAVLTETGQALSQPGNPRVGSGSVCICVETAIDDSCLGEGKNVPILVNEGQGPLNGISDKLRPVLTLGQLALRWNVGRGAKDHKIFATRQIMHLFEAIDALWLLQVLEDALVRLLDKDCLAFLQVIAIEGDVIDAVALCGHYQCKLALVRPLALE